MTSQLVDRPYLLPIDRHGFDGDVDLAAARSIHSRPAKGRRTLDVRDGVQRCAVAAVAA